MYELSDYKFITKSDVESKSTKRKYNAVQFNSAIGSKLDSSDLNIINFNGRISYQNENKTDRNLYYIGYINANSGNTIVFIANRDLHDEVNLYENSQPITYIQNWFKQELTTQFIHNIDFKFYGRVKNEFNHLLPIIKKEINVKVVNLNDVFYKLLDRYGYPKTNKYNNQFLEKPYVSFINNYSKIKGSRVRTYLLIKNPSYRETIQIPIGNIYDPKEFIADITKDMIESITFINNHFTIDDFISDLGIEGEIPITKSSYTYTSVINANTFIESLKSNKRHILDIYYKTFNNNEMSNEYNEFKTKVINFSLVDNGSNTIDTETVEKMKDYKQFLTTKGVGLTIQYQTSINLPARLSMLFGANNNINIKDYPYNVPTYDLISRFTFAWLKFYNKIDTAIGLINMIRIKII